MDSLGNIEELCGFTLYWRVENFNNQPDINFSVKSPIFKIKALKSKWSILIERKGECLAAFLFKETNPMCCNINFSVSLLTGTNWITIQENIKYRFKSGGKGYGVPELVSLENLDEEQWTYLPNGSLTISFRIWNNKLVSECSQCLIISRLTNKNELGQRPVEYFSSLKPSDLLSFPPSYAFYSNQVQFFSEDLKSKEVKTQITQTDTIADFSGMEDLLQLFKQKEFSFVTLRTSSRDFSVHKAVLCAKSPVFKVMFEGQMKENYCNLVDIDDIDSQTMASLINFLHFQPLDDLNWDSAVTLYYAADKYQIDSLKDECVVLLKKEFSVENVCDAFLLADLHQDEALMSCAQEYFCKNSKLILTTKYWKEFLCHTELAAEVLHKLAEKM